MSKKIEPFKVIQVAGGLLSDDGSNYEYDRAIVEMVQALLDMDVDMDDDAKDTTARLLRLSVNRENIGLVNPDAGLASAAGGEGGTVSVGDEVIDYRPLDSYPPGTVVVLAQATRAHNECGPVARITSVHKKTVSGKFYFADIVRDGEPVNITLDESAILGLKMVN